MDKFTTIAKAAEILGVSPTTLSARLYGSRSNKNKKLIEAIQKAVETST